MQVNPLNLTTPVLPTAVAGVQTLRISAGDVSQIQTGVIVAASVLRTSGSETVLDVGGRSLSVQGPLTLSAGDVLNVRLNGGANPTLELIGQPTRPLSRPGPTPGSNQTAVRVGVIDVLAQESNGRVRVTIDGEEVVANSDRPLTNGNRYITQVERGPTGIALKALPATQQIAATVATALLRGTPATQIGDPIEPLIQELEAAIAKPLPARLADAPILTVTTARTAAIDVRTALQAVIPPPGEPPTVETLKALVQDGGQQFEAKLSREVVRTSDLSPTPVVADPSDPNENVRTANALRPNKMTETLNGKHPSIVRLDAEACAEFPTTIHPSQDLKGGLLNLLRSVSGLSAEFPAAEAVLTGIERQQAVNVLARQDGGPLVVQVPFPDGPHWRTVSLGIEPDRTSTTDESGRSSSFRVMMHVPLSDLGETWIDAGADGPRLRAILFLSDSPARERVRSELPTLRQELQAAGFTDVLLDVRAATDLTDQQRRRANAIRSVAPESGGLLDVRA